MTVQTKKPESVTVIVVNRKTKKSKSFTVYGSLEEVYKIIQKTLKKTTGE